MKNDYRNNLLSILFFLTIALWFIPQSIPSGYRDMRDVKKISSVKFDNWSNFTLDVTNYINDNFPCRPYFIIFYHYITNYLLHADSKQVLYGKNNELFYIVDNTIDDFCGADRLSISQLRQWKINLENKYNYLKSINIIYLFVIAPNKASIYSEYLPDYIQNSKGITKADQLIEYMKKSNSDVPILDLRSDFINNKNHGTLYLKNDSHWNGFGQILAFNSIINRLKKYNFNYDSSFASQHFNVTLGMLKPVNTINNTYYNGDLVDQLAINFIFPKSKDYVLTVYSVKGLTIYNRKDLSSSIFSTYPQFKLPITTDYSGGKDRVVMFCDSFMRVGGLSNMNNYYPYSLVFSHFTSFWCIPDINLIKYFVNTDKPNIIIEEQSERLLKTSL
jgi:alginate O-acetyltransferase complex protein AlgJ